MIDTSSLRWSPFSVAAAVAVSTLSAVAFVLLELRGYATGPDIPGFGVVTSSLAGGIVLWWRHPKTWWIVLLLYVPVMVAVLLVGAVIVLARFGYRLET